MILGLAGIVFGAVLADLAIRFIYQPQIAQDGLEIRLGGGLLLTRIPFGEIEDVQRMSVKDALVQWRMWLGCLRFGVVGIGADGAVMVRLRNGVRWPLPPSPFKHRTLLFFRADSTALVTSIRERLASKS